MKKLHLCLWCAIYLLQGCAGPGVKTGREVASSEGICDREERVLNAILESYKAEAWFFNPQKYLLTCQNMNRDQLASIRVLDLQGLDIVRLRFADMEGLSGLEELNLSDNDLVAFPENLESFTQLKRLDLSFNDLRIPIEKNLGQLQNLEILSVAFNRLHGTIPEELGNLGRLVHLDLSDNELSGPLHESLANLSSIEWLDLSHNQLSGPIPPFLAQLHRLNWLDLSHNHLDDSIPESLIERGKQSSRQFTFLPQTLPE